MRPEKQQLVQDIEALIEPSAYLFMVTYSGLTVSGFRELRGQLAETGAECHVIPNRLFLRAAAESGIKGLSALSLAGGTALVTGGDDAAQVARSLRSFGTRNKAVSFKAGVVDRKLYPAADMLRLAELPSRDVLRAQLLRVLEAPKRQLVGVLNAKAASILYVLRAYLDKQENPSE